MKLIKSSIKFIKMINYGNSNINKILIYHCLKDMNIKTYFDYFANRLKYILIYLENDYRGTIWINNNNKIDNLKRLIELRDT